MRETEKEASRHTGKQENRKTGKQAGWDFSNNGDRIFQRKTEACKTQKALGYELQTKQKGKGWMGTQKEREQRKIKERENLQCPNFFAFSLSS